MCWNQSVSLNTFLVGLFAVSLALYNKIITPLSGLGAMALISMQLIEYFAWGNLENKEAISLISKLGLGLILVQPMISYLVCIENFTTHVIPLLYLCFLVLYFSVQTIDYSMHKAKNGHLSWNWLTASPLLIFIWLAFLLTPLVYAKHYMIAGGLLATVLISLYTYYTANTWGSMWCWIANVYSLYLLGSVFMKDLC
jgi:hypothetical protein